MTGLMPLRPVPLISVIMPAYNCAPDLAEAVASVQAQTCADWELIIVDDASTDDSFAIASALAAKDARITVVQLAQNGGAAVARNTAIRLARGRYIAFLDADDLWLCAKLEHQIAFMAACDSALSFTAFTRQSNGHGKRVSVPRTVTRAQLLRGNVIGCSTAVYDTANVGKVEMPDIRMRQDFGLWLRILALTPQAHGLDEVLTTYRRQPGSLSSSLFRRTGYTWRLYREEEGLGRLTSARYLAAHLLNRARALLIGR